MRSTENAQKAERLFELPLIVAALLVLPAIALQDDQLSPLARDVGIVLDVAIWVAFALELVVMLLVSPSPAQWLRQNWTSPLIVILTPPFLPPFLAGIRLLRLLRLLRLIRVASIAKRIFSLEGLRYGSVIAATSVILGGISFAAVEPGLDPIDGVWWAITTVTTVGYGDIFPTTDSAKVIAVMVMGVGIGFVALLTGVAAERFLNLSEEEAAEGRELDQILTELKALRSQVATLEARLEPSRRSPPQAR